jgi:hypothetical protein
LKAGDKDYQIVYWGRSLDWHNQTLTPNPDTLYFMGFYDTNATGPTVSEVPPAGDDGSLNGNFVTLWQAALEDAGLLGVDRGAGVKFVIVPPGYKENVPNGYELLRSDTFTGYFLVRPNLKSHRDADVEQHLLEYCPRRRPRGCQFSKVENLNPSLAGQLQASRLCSAQEPFGRL